MKSINAADLILKSDAELIALIRAVSQSLLEMEADSPEYIAAIGSLGILKGMLAARRMKGPGF